MDQMFLKKKGKHVNDLCKVFVKGTTDSLFISKGEQIIFFNKGFALMHGIPEKGESKRNLLHFIAPESREEVLREFSRKKGRPTGIRTKYYRLHQDGSHIPTEVRANAIVHDREKIWVGICIDLSDQKEPEEELRQVKELSENILQSSHDPITVVDENGSIVYLNPASERLMNYTKEAVIGKPLSIFYEDKHLLQEKLETVKKTNQPISYEAVIVDKQNSRHYQVVTRSPLRDSKGRYIGSVAISRDITEKMKMEERIRMQERLAYIGQLTSLLAHEIRTPLSSIKINVQILMKKLNLLGNDRRRMEIIDSETKRLEIILDEVLDFAKPKDLSLELVNINQVIEKVLAILKQKLLEKHIRVRKGMDKSLPMMLLEVGKMEQVLLNIVQNSFDAMKFNGRLEIRTREERIGDDRMIKIRISDNGIGIEEDKLKYIFEPFYTSKRQGAGLGLTNVKKIIDAHGGIITVDSHWGKGTDFNIFLKER
jgi:PAS domain S-box-containing protein